MNTQNAAVAAIQFALETDEGLAFLRCWNEGNFDAIRREWPEAPEAVFVGADPLHPATANSRALPMGTKTFSVEQGPEDLDLLRTAYEAVPLLPGQTV